MLKQIAKDFYNSLYKLPPDERDMEDLAVLIANKIFDDIEKNSTSVVWNYGLDSVIFTHKEIEGKESLRSIKERYIGNGNNQSNTDESHGTGASGDNEADQNGNLSNQQSELEQSLQAES